MEELKVKKPTQKEMLTELARLAEENNKVELAEFCYDRIAQLEKKASASKAKSAESQVFLQKRSGFSQTFLSSAFFICFVFQMKIISSATMSSIVPLI